MIVLLNFKLKKIKHGIIILFLVCTKTLLMVLEHEVCYVYTVISPNLSMTNNLYFLSIIEII